MTSHRSAALAWSRRIACVLAVTTALGVAVAVAPAEAAVTAVTLTGRGSGHGQGLSQYGAKGRASAGISTANILAFYYPGTTLATTGYPDSDSIRVQLTGNPATDSAGTPIPNSTTVAVTPGLKLKVGSAAPAALPTSVTVSGKSYTVSAWQLRGATTLATWANIAALGTTPNWVQTTSAADSQTSASFVDDTSVTNATGKVRVVLADRIREYWAAVSGTHAGSVTAVAHPNVNGIQTQDTVVTNSYTDYLAVAAASEMPSYWPAGALQAQVVAARSYARNQAAPSYVYDICDSTRCQAFNGLAEYNLDANSSLRTTWYVPAGIAAVAATAGQVVTYGGSPALTTFSSSNGGYTQAGSKPYLVAKPDSYDTMPSWTATITAATLQAKYPAIGAYSHMVIQRDGLGAYNGRATTLTLYGSGGSQQLAAADFVAALGLQSRMFTPADPAQHDLNNDGLPDVVARTSAGVLWRWLGRSTTTAPSLAAGAKVGTGWNTMGALTMALGLHNSGETELIAVEKASGKLWSYPATADGWLGNRTMIGASSWQNMNLLIGVTNFSGTGPGLITRRTDGNLYYYGRSSTGTLLAARQIGNSWSSMRQIIAMGDWNADGKPDLGAVDSTGKLWLYPGNGSGGFLPRIMIGSGGWAAMTGMVGGIDWTGDGAVDLLVTDTSGVQWVYPGTGTGGFAARRQVGTSWTPYTMVG